MTSSLTYALREAGEETEEVTAEHLPEPALIARSRMKSVSSMPYGSESGLRAVADTRSTSILPPPRFIEDDEEQLPTEPYASARLLHSPQYMPEYEETQRVEQLNSPSSLPPPGYLDDYDDEPTLAYQSPASSLPPPKYSMRVPSGTYGYSDVEVRSANGPRPESLGPAALPSTAPMHSVDMGILQMSALRLLLARLTEDAGPAARPMILVEIQTLGARPETFPRILASDLLARLAERLDVPETRRNFIIDGRSILDRELYVQHARG